MSLRALQPSEKAAEAVFSACADVCFFSLPSIGYRIAARAAGTREDLARASVRAPQNGRSLI